MTTQYLRQYLLQIGNETEGIEIDALKVTFDIEKTIDNRPNPGKIIIWNLSKENQKRILSGDYHLVKFHAGYDTLRLIYAGDIVQKRIRREGLDMVMELACGDGHTDYREASIAMTIAAGATDADIIQTAALTMTHTKTGTIDKMPSRALPRAKVLVGNTREVLSKIVKNADAHWSIQDGELMVLRPDHILAGDVILLSEETGMIGSPEDTDNGLALSCLLNPALRIGGLVRVESMIVSYNGDYKIAHIQHSGDSHGGSWISKLTVVGGTFQEAGYE
jgi:hypothetical protein